jgi:hypothetical protein
MRNFADCIYSTKFKYSFRRKIIFKGIVRRKLRWAIGGINRQRLLYCIGAYIIFKFKGIPFFKVDKTSFRIKQSQK